MEPTAIAFWTLVVAAAGVIVSAAYTVLTFLLWRVTSRTIELNSKTLYELNRQVSHQIALSNSLADQNITDAHRNLFLGILQDKDLLELFAKNDGISSSVARKNYLASILINHCSTIFNYLKSGILKPIHLESYAKDVKYMFSMPFISQRWDTVKIYHSVEFGNFIERLVESDEEGIIRLINELQNIDVPQSIKMRPSS